MEVILNMKAIKLLSLLMALVMACCVMVGCGNKAGAEDTTTAPAAPTYSATVTITVTDMDGNAVIDAVSHAYTSGTVAPTPYAIVDDYHYMTMDNGEGKVKVDDGGRLVAIDKLEAVDGSSYWRITVNGKDIAPEEFSSQALNNGDVLVIALMSTANLPAA